VPTLRFSLDISNNQIVNLRPLARLTKLEVIFIANNQIVDLKPLANLGKLARIEAFGNKVTEKDCPIPREYCNFDPKNQWK
jgi:internalin A